MANGNTALASKLARTWAVDVKPMVADETVEWTRVRGINSFQPGLDPNFEDSTDYDNEGWSSQEKTLMGWSLTITFIEKRTTDESKAQDPGQLILEEASDKFESESMVQVRWYERDGGKAYRGVAAVQYEPQGGAPTALSSVNVTLQGNGERQRLETNPATEAEGGAEGGQGE